LEGLVHDLDAYHIMIDPSSNHERAGGQARP
jgi:hypothetical protein